MGGGTDRDRRSGVFEKHRATIILLKRSATYVVCVSMCVRVWYSFLFHSARRCCFMPTACSHKNRELSIASSYNIIMVMYYYIIML